MMLEKRSSLLRDTVVKKYIRRCIKILGEKNAERTKQKGVENIIYLSLLKFKHLEKNTDLSGLFIIAPYHIVPHQFKWIL